MSELDIAVKQFKCTLDRKAKGANVSKKTVLDTMAKDKLRREEELKKLWTPRGIKYGC